MVAQSVHQEINAEAGVNQDEWAEVPSKKKGRNKNAGGWETVKKK